MCTVAVLPTPRGGYLVAHNRDESRARARGVAPRRFRRTGLAFLAPRDPDGGGTWLAVNGAGMTLCLLNAPEAPGRRLPVAPVSRGLVLWRVADARSLADLRRRLAAARPWLQQVRSFHLVAVAPGRVPRLARAIWNGTRLVWQRRSGSALFTSSGVDPEGARRIRGAGWRRFLRRRGLDPAALGAFMASHDPEPGPLSVCMHRPEAVTVSRILVQVEGRRASLAYLDGPPCAPGSVATRRLALAGRS